MAKKNNGIDLLKKLDVLFHNSSKPTKFYNVSDHYRQRFEQEFSVLEALDWQSVSPEKLSNIYEPNTFLTEAAYKYLAPNIFHYCIKYSDSTPRVDLVNAFFLLPIFSIQTDYFCGYSREQKEAFWQAFTYINDTLEFDLLDEEESFQLRMKLNLD